jgi:hypothetical protein
MAAGRKHSHAYSSAPRTVMSPVRPWFTKSLAASGSRRQIHPHQNRPLIIYDVFKVRDKSLGGKNYGPPLTASHRYKTEPQMERIGECAFPVSPRSRLWSFADEPENFCAKGRFQRIRWMNRWRQYFILCLVIEHCRYRQKILVSVRMSGAFKVTGP